MTLFFPLGVSQFAETLVSICRLQVRLGVHRYDYIKIINFDKNVLRTYCFPIFSQNFLLMEERNVETPLQHNVNLNSDDIKANIREVNQHENERGIFVENLNAKWSSDHNENTLSNISLRVKDGELLAVIGILSV